MWKNKIYFRLIILGLGATTILVTFQLRELKIFDRSYRFKETVIKEISKTSDEEAIFSFIRENIEDLLQNSGVEETVEIVQYAVERGKMKFVYCHNLLHIVGHEAYQVYSGDLNRLAEHLTPMCQYAYEHGVDAEIVSSGEAGKFNKLREWCGLIKSQSGNENSLCYHGAGHAFMRGNIGDIETALRQCEKIDPSGDPSNCWAGVFSEFGALLLGYDSDTGLSIQGKRIVSNPFVPPLKFCESLELRHREPCVSQLTKTVVDVNDAPRSFIACSQPGYGLETKKICTRFFSFFYFDQRLHFQEKVDIPEAVFKLSEPLQKEFISGALQGFTEAKQSGLTRDEVSFCKTFRSDSDSAFCLSLL